MHVLRSNSLHVEVDEFDVNELGRQRHKLIEAGAVSRIEAGEVRRRK